MILQNEQDPDKPRDDVQVADTPTPATPERPVLIDPAQFFTDTAVTVPGGVQGIVTCGRDGAPNDHLWNTRGADSGTWMDAKAKDKKPAYFTMGAFNRDAVTRFKGRAKGNVLALGGFWLDVEGSEAKGGYEGRKAVLAAVVEFGRATSLRPTHLVMTGSGGAHLHYVLSEPITPTEHSGRAHTLVALAAQHGFRIDAQCTTDAARIMRAPGSIHQKTGVEVQAYRWRVKNFTLQEWDKLTGYVPGAVMAPGIGATPSKYDTAVNDDLALSHDSQPADFERILSGCDTLRAMANDPKSVTPDLWFAGMQIARHCTNPEEALRQISETHSKWDEAKDTRRMMSLDKGPAKCAAIRGAGGAGCEVCKHAGRGSGGEWMPPGFGTPVMLGRGALAVMGEVLDGDQEKSTNLQLILPDWATRRVQGEDGKLHIRKIRPHNTSENVAALAKHRGWSIQYNVMSKRPELARDGVLVAGDDADNVALTMFGDDAVRAGLARDGLSALVDAVAVSQSFHPVLNWIKGIPWDGQDRRQAFYGTLTLAQPSKATLSYKLMDKWMLQGIGALMEPKGIAASGLLVLCGPQYVGKSYWALHLLDGALGAVGTGLGLDPKEKDSVLRAIRFFISELAELDGTFRRADIASLKGFLTDGTDTVRLPYARRDTPFARRTIFCASVNESRFLVDETGNRRFWTLEITGCTVLPANEMQQVWAQYMHRYEQGERWVLDPALLAELNESNADHEAVDPLRERIATRWDWDSVDWSALHPDHWASAPGVVWKSASDVCLAIGIERPTRSEATRVGGILRSLTGGILSARKSHGVKLLAVPLKGSAIS